MKKIATLVLTLCLCLACLPLFSACGEEEEKYWLDTNEKFQAFVTDEIPKYENGFDFGENINLIIHDNYATYPELDQVYTPLFKLSIGFLKDYKECFLIEPLNKNGDVKQAFFELNASISELTTNLNNFKETKLPEFIEGIETQDDPEDIISLDFLKNFKRDFISLTTQIVEFGDQLLELYIMAYQDIPTLYDGEFYAELTEPEIQNYTRLALSKSILYTLHPTIDYINAFNGTYVKYENDMFFEIITEYQTIISSEKIVVADAQTLHAFSYTFEAYANDVEIFDTSLEKIDLVALANEYNFNCYDYANGNQFDAGDQQRYAHATKVLNFSSYSMYTLKNKLMELYQ